MLHLCRYVYIITYKQNETTKMTPVGSCMCLLLGRGPSNEQKTEDEKKKKRKGD